VGISAPRKEHEVVPTDYRVPSPLRDLKDPSDCTGLAAAIRASQATVQPSTIDWA
jgi:hypothetical protein